VPNWIELALSQQGKPYIWGSGSGAGGRGRQHIGANGQPTGYDCSGFVSWVLKEAAGIDLPAYTGTAHPATRALRPGETPRAGDVVFYNMNIADPSRQHIALYLGGDKIVQSGGAGNGVNVDDVRSVGTPEYRRVLTSSPQQEELLASPQYAPMNEAGQSVGRPLSYGNRGGGTPSDKSAWGPAAPYVEQLVQAATKYGIPVNLLAAKVNVESGGNPTARSGAGAQGLLQLMPGTARSLGVTDPNDPVQNLDAGAKYFRQMYDQFGNWDDALRAYNAGPNGNWNNSETIGHVKKVGQWADTIGAAIGAGGSGGLGAPGGGGPGGGGDDDMSTERGLRGSPNGRRVADAASSTWAGFWDKLNELNSGYQDAAKAKDKAAALEAWKNTNAARVRRGQQPLPLPAELRPTPPQQGGFAQDQPTEFETPGATPAPVGPGIRQITPPAAAGTPGAAPAEKSKPSGWVDPATIRNPAYMGIIGQWNDALIAQQTARDKLAAAAAGSDEALIAQRELETATNNVRGLAATTANIIQAAEKEEGGQFAPGTSAKDKAFTIVKRNPQTGQWETQVIQNPSWEEGADVRAQTIAGNYTLQRGREGDAAALQRQREELLARQGLSGAEIASREKISGEEISSREAIAGLNATTSRVTTALSAAVQQRSQDIEAQIRAGELSLREGTEQFNQWYKQNVEAPLAILQQKRETERYKIEQQNAVTQRATAQAEHQRGIANIGQQMWGQAAQAYNQMIPLTVGEGWGQGFQQNLAAGGGNYTPNQGATYNVPESLDAFATRKVAEMLKGVSPYADSILGAESQIGTPGQAMGGDQMTGLQNQATGVASNALANPFQMPALPSFQMPGQVDVAGMAGAGMGDGQLTQELDQYLPSYTG
jgi:Transglycosylase SLT domain/NlpC/P60 family